MIKKTIQEAWTLTSGRTAPTVKDTHQSRCPSLGSLDKNQQDKITRLGTHLRYRQTQAIRLN